MAYYPVFLELERRPCLVIGGGKEGQRKVEGLLAAGGRVTVVAPELTAELERRLGAGEIACERRRYREGDLEGYELCVVATDDGEVSAQVAAEGKRQRVWVNAADDPANCDFILPSVIRRGPITIAASTGGGSPALARRLREELEAYLTEEMPALADLLAEVRAELHSRGITPSPDVWQRAIDEELRVLLAQGKHRQAKVRVLEALGAGDLVGELVAAESGRKGAQRG